MPPRVSLSKSPEVIENKGSRSEKERQEKIRAGKLLKWCDLEVERPEERARFLRDGKGCGS